MIFKKLFSKLENVFLEIIKLMEIRLMITSFSVEVWTISLFFRKK